MKTDEEIRNEVILALQTEPVLNQTTLNVAVKNGIVTLMGTVNSSSKKISVWRVACCIKSVRAVDLAITVLPAMNSDSDNEIKRFFYLD